MVLQRWQSVLLFVAALVMACFTFFSLGQVQLTDYSLNFTSLGFSIEGESTNGAPTGYILYTWPLFILSIMSFILPLITIFLYKNLNLQKKVCIISLFFILSVIVAGCIYGYNQFENAAVSWSSLACAPLLAFISVLMAYNRINRDQRTLRAADRLR